MMLQQTQAARVEGPYRKFLRLFPSALACARAPAGDVVRAWAGLGYNRRAVQLHAAAKVVVESHRGRVPDDLDALLALPGVGPYTARAVLAFAFERDVAVVDVNVARVLARAVVGAPLSPAQGQRLADTVKAKGRPWLWNQSLLELGAVVCTARSPSCTSCPLAGCCRWARSDGAGCDPASTKRPQ
jgi:A/G-specific adenine glycosylase